MLRFIVLLVPLSLLALASCSTDPGTGGDGEKEPPGTLTEAYESLDETVRAVLDAVAPTQEHAPLPPTPTDGCGGLEGIDYTSERHTYVRDVDQVDDPATALATVRATLEARGVEVYAETPRPEFTRLTFGNERFAGEVNVGNGGALVFSAETSCYPAGGEGRPR